MERQRVVVLICLSLLALVAGSARASSSEDDVLNDLVVSMLEEQEEIDAMPVTLIEAAAEADTMGPECKAGAHCPMADGICCAGGEVCCPVGTRCGEGNKCRRSSTQLALQAAKKKMQEEGQKTIKREAAIKAKTERGQKAFEEEKAKTRAEGKAKRAAVKKEAHEKKKRRHAEAKAKKAKDRREKRQKKAEKARKAAERKKANARAAAKRKLRRRKARQEKEKKKADAAREKSRKADRLKAEKKSKAQEKAKKAGERASKEAEKRRRAAAEVKTLLSGISVPRRGHIMQKSLEWKGAFTYMLWIKPHSINAHWSNIFHKGQSNGHRNPAVWFYPSQTRLHIRSGVQSSHNYGIDPGLHLPMYHWTHVTIQHNTGMMRVLYNGRQVGRTGVSGPMANGGPLYFSDPWYHAAGCRVAHMIYAPRIMKDNVIAKQAQRRPKDVGVKTLHLVSGATSPRRNHRLKTSAQMGAFTGSFTYFLWVRPHGVNPHWSNIFHKGQSNGNRNPAVWFYPGHTRLHIRSGIFNHGNPGVDPGQQLPQYKWTHVAFQHKHGQMRVFYDGRQVGAHNMAGPVQNPGPLYFSSPWYHAAPCKVASMYYTAKYVSPSTITTKARRRPAAIKRPYNRGLSLIRRRHRPQRGFIAAHGHDGRWRANPFQGAVSWMFWVYPMGTIGAWCNLFHKGHHNTQRNAAVWFYPGHLRLHIRSGATNSWNFGHDPGHQMGRHRWTHVAMTHRAGLYQVYYNANKVLQTGAHRPIWNNGPLYASDPWHHACNAYISDLRFYNKIASQHDVTMAKAENAIH